MAPSKPAEERTLADMIMEKLAAGDYTEGDNQKKPADLENTLDAKVLAAYSKVGVVLRAYKSGKLPKAFKIIPQTVNWEELLMLTSPSTWSPHSHYQSCKMFASNLNQKIAQRYFNIFLLPAV